MIEPFYLIDRNKKKRLKIRRAYEVAVNMSIKYGREYPMPFREEWIKECWTFDDYYPSQMYFKTQVKLKNIMKILQTSANIEDEIWNQHFMHGVSKNGERTDNADRSNRFPSIRWFNNPSLKEIVNLCPFGGRKGVTFSFPRHKVKGKNKRMDRDHWSFVPVLEMKCDEKSLSFVAGVLAGGVIVKDKAGSLVKYKYDAIDAIKRLNIPIESDNKHFILISPIWPALFTLKMPIELRERWLKVKHPCKVGLYAPILWRSYVRRNAVPKGIPYLQCKRSILYKFKCEEGAMKSIENLRFELGLTSLDLRIREIVQMWAKQSKVKPKTKLLV